MRSVFLAAALLLSPQPLAAQPRVVADVPPVHALVARVMEGVGAPALIVGPGASPHGHALKPSDALALAEADLAFWIGEGLTPWLAGPLAGLGEGARAVELMEAPGVALLPLREGARFAAHDHGGHDEGGHGHEDHGHDDHDPHIWLDPANAQAMMRAIAAALGAADPENAARYAANAEAGVAEIGALAEEIDAALAPVRGRPFLVFHDAYHYFEARFDIEAAGALAHSDAVSPGPARLAEARDAIRALGAVCVFHEPQAATGLVETATEGTGARIGALDPLGTGLEPGPGLYAGMMRGLARGLRDCLGG
ncbi:MAG: zinc ABC transporter substrate-binding protein [Pikeienuella sp.]